MSRFRFVSAHAEVYGVKRLCRLAGVSRSGFYDYLRRGRDPGPRAVRDGQLVEAIRQIYATSRCTYGAPRVHGQLRRRGERLGRKRVARLMRAHGLVGAHVRRRWRRGRPDVAPAPDLLRRDFAAARPNRKWVADLTEFDTLEGKWHLAGIRDCCTKEIVGWAMGPRRVADLVVDALVMALARRDPDQDGVIHHADRGSQYTSLAFDAVADLPGMRLSFGSTGDCYDNAAMETFWATMKREIAWMRGSLLFSSRAEARGWIFDYLEIFYNRQRHQAALGDLTPREYLQRVTA